LSVRALFTALIVCILFFSVTNVSAQNDLEEDRPDEPAIETQNRITAAERSLTLGGSDTVAVAPGSAVSVFSIFRVLLTLVVVAAAIYGLVFFLKFRRASRAKGELDPFLKILASVPLGTNRGIHVISVGPQAWLVGSAENGVTMISEIGDKDTINAMLLEDSKRIAAPAGAAGHFIDFKAILEKFGISTRAESSGPDKIRKRSERLKGL
jgi:flagellar protein FliO/FliZ